MKVGLRVLSAGTQEGKILPITLSQFLIGRDKQCQLRPASPSISKRHCAILVQDDKVLVRDFDSTNGTFINEEPLKGQLEIKHKDHLRIGPLEFEVLIAGQNTVEKKSAPSDGVTKQSEAAAKSNATVKDASASTKEAISNEPAKKEEKELEKAAVGSGADSDDDDIADMLLAMQDDSEGGLFNGGEEVPEGSTVMDMVVPPMPGDEGEKAEGKKDPSKLQKEKEKQANTSTAAKSLLEKYMKRPR